MKVKDAIAYLQTCDPESYLDFGYGVTHLQNNPGYWDGNYCYFDEDGNHMTSTEGSKVSIYIMDSYEDVAYYYLERKLSDEEIISLTEEDVLSRIRPFFKCDYSGFSDPVQVKEKEDRFEKCVTEAIKKSLSIYREILREFKKKD